MAWSCTIELVIATNRPYSKLDSHLQAYSIMVLSVSAAIILCNAFASGWTRNTTTGKLCQQQSLSTLFMSAKKEDEDEDPVPVDFIVVLTDTSGLEYRVRLGEFQNLQPAIKPEIFKSRLFWDDAESEVILQYVSLPLGKIKSSAGKPVSAGAIRSVGFIFDSEKNGTVLLDQVGFSR